MAGAKVVNCRIESRAYMLTVKPVSEYSGDRASGSGS